MTGAWSGAASKLHVVTQLANAVVTRILQKGLILGRDQRNFRSVPV